MSNFQDVPKQNRISLEGLSKWLGPKHSEKIRSPVTILGKHVPNSERLFDGKLFEQWGKNVIVKGTNWIILLPVKRGDYFMNHYKDPY